MQLQVSNEALNSPTSDDELFRYTSGPRGAEVIIVGEAWEREEAAAQRPFIGSSGKELDRILSDAGLQRPSILCTNVVAAQPPGNDFTHFLAPTKEKLNYVPLNGLKAKEPLRRGLDDLYRLIDSVKPKLLIAAGNIPLWALSDRASISTDGPYKVPAGITSWRGSQIFSRSIHGRTYPLLPIIHPAAILREWAWRQITVHDLRRASGFIRNGWMGWEPPANTFTIHRPTFTQTTQRLDYWLGQLTQGPLEIACDLETFRRKFISVVGIADRHSELCIPLIWSPKGEGQIESYFTVPQEQEIWQRLKLLLEHPNVEIIGQNFIYDTEWFHRGYNIRALVSFDTMVAHHLLFPGTPKRLDYLASLYCEHYAYWKDESGDWNEFPNDADRYWKYNCKDTRATYDCAQVLRTALKSQGLEALYRFQIEQWKFSRKLSLRGMNFDIELQKKMRLELMEEANAISEWLLAAVPEFAQYTSTGKPWFDSPLGTAKLFYETLGLEPVLHKDTGRPTTNDSALAELSERRESSFLRPLLDRLRHLRSLGVFISHFLDAKPGIDGRFRCSFNIAHPETLRWSSNANGFGEGTNMQNLPKGEE